MKRRGGMAERLNAAVLKTVVGVTPPGVRIPLPPFSKARSEKPDRKRSMCSLERWQSGRMHVLAKDATG